MFWFKFLLLVFVLFCFFCLFSERGQFIINSQLKQHAIYYYLFKTFYVFQFLATATNHNMIEECNADFEKLCAK